jgi:hypothetical protein
MLERRGLGEAGLTYICQRLAGGRTVSRLLLDGLDLAAGTASAYLPPAVSDVQTARFAEAGLTHLAQYTGTRRFGRDRMRARERLLASNWRYPSALIRLTQRSGRLSQRESEPTR